MQFDFRKKVIDNVALQKILVNKTTAFGVTVHVSLLVINLKANTGVHPKQQVGA